MCIELLKCHNVASQLLFVKAVRECLPFRSTPKLFAEEKKARAQTACLCGLDAGILASREDNPALQNGASMARNTSSCGRQTGVISILQHAAISHSR